MWRHSRRCATLSRSLARPLTLDRSVMSKLSTKTAPHLDEQCTRGFEYHLAKRLDQRSSSRSPPPATPPPTQEPFFQRAPQPVQDEPTPTTHDVPL